MQIEFTIPIKTTVSLNSRMHWAKRAKLVKAERQAARLLASGQLHPSRIPSSVKLTREYSGVRPDDDGLRGYLKGVRDGIADAIGINDNDPRCQWLYDQRKAKRADFGVEVEVRYVD